MRAARTHKSSSATAVLQSILALSSLHRYGVQSQAVKLKLASLKALTAAASSGIKLGVTEVIQHIAAGMLLCSFEVRNHSAQRLIICHLLTQAPVRSTNLLVPQVNGHVILPASSNCLRRPQFQRHRSMKTWLPC